MGGRNTARRMSADNPMRTAAVPAAPMTGNSPFAMVAPPCTLKTANRIDATGGNATLLELFIRFQSSRPTQVLLLYGVLRPLYQEEGEPLFRQPRPRHREVC